MKIGILGSGDVGRVLGRGFIALGHDVKMGAREATNEKAAAWAKEAGPNASTGTFADAAAFGDLIVLATLGVANPEVIRAAGPEKFRGKVVIDATNPLDFSGGPPPRLAVGPHDSGGEQVQKLRQTPGSSRPSTSSAMPICSGRSFPEGRRTCSFAAMTAAPSSPSSES